MNTPSLPTKGQILWRCRRGMLELDLLLKTWAEKRLNHLDEQQTRLFLQLLDYPDQQLLPLLMGHESDTDEEINALAREIRQAAFRPGCS